MNLIEELIANIRKSPNSYFIQNDLGVLALVGELESIKQNYDKLEKQTKKLRVETGTLRTKIETDKMKLGALLKKFPKEQICYGTGYFPFFCHGIDPFNAIEIDEAKSELEKMINDL